MEQERIDEALELIWLIEEEGHTEFNRFKLDSDDVNFDELVNEMIKNNLVILKEDKVGFTEKGRMLAKGLIRRHRLAEQLFTDVFELAEPARDADAH